MRLFVAIPVGEAARRSLELLVRGMRRPADGLRWTAPEGWHITLVFLGETAAEKLPRLVDELNSIRATAFSVEFGEPEVFERAGALVVGVQPSAGLTALQSIVTRAAEAAGFRREERAYRPHLTLARAKRGEQIRVQPGRATVAGFTAREFVLFESFLEPAGARYEAKARLQLKS